MPRVADPDESPVALGSLQRFGKGHFLRSLLVKKLKQCPGEGCCNAFKLFQDL